MRPLSYTDNNMLENFGVGSSPDATFLCGIDLEGYGGVNEDKLMSGIYTYGSDVFKISKFGQAVPSSGLECFTVAMFDA